MLLSNIIPKMIDSKFKKILKPFGILKYEILSPKLLVLYTNDKSRVNRENTLKELAVELKPNGATYSNSKTISSAGGIVIGSAKIVLKPSKKGGQLILKPNIFGKNQNLVDEKIPSANYYNALLNAITETDKLDSLQKEILTTLAANANRDSPKTKTAMRNVMKHINVSLNINTINNDFGELLGPLAIMSRKLLPIDSGSATVFIPGRSNEPLLDYKITDSTKEYKISAKSGEATNTLKPGDVIKLIEDSKHYKKKWKEKPEFKVLEILNTNSWKEGPVDAAIYLKNNGYKKNFTSIKKNEYTEESRQAAENALVKFSKEVMDFSQIFKDATTAKVYYVKFLLEMSGAQKWQLVKNTNQKKNEAQAQKRIVFRSKNYVGRHNGDKLGFQV
jgi:hypothetical protein